jgi:hypothetical protein
MKRTRIVLRAAAVYLAIGIAIGFVQLLFTKIPAEAEQILQSFRILN